MASLLRQDCTSAGFSTKALAHERDVGADIFSARTFQYRGVGAVDPVTLNVMTDRETHEHHCSV